METLKTFLVERYIPGLREPANELVSRLETTTRRENTDHVEWLWSVVLTGEDTCLCLFRAQTTEDVELANDRVGAAYDRVVEVVAIGPAARPPSEALPPASTRKPEVPLEAAEDI